MKPMTQSGAAAFRRFDARSGEGNLDYRIRTLAACEGLEPKPAKCIPAEHLAKAPGIPPDAIGRLGPQLVETRRQDAGRGGGQAVSNGPGQVAGPRRYGAGAVPDPRVMLPVQGASGQQYFGRRKYYWPRKAARRMHR